MERKNSITEGEELKRINIPEELWKEKNREHYMQSYIICTLQFNRVDVITGINSGLVRCVARIKKRTEYFCCKET
jgi:hypothetical protein